MRLAGRAAIVTGAGNGIGRAEAIALANAGAKVVVNDIAIDESGERAAERVAQEIRRAGGEAVANLDTVATMEGGAHIVETALDAFGRVDILINNAGFAYFEQITDIAEELWDRMIAVHLKGSFATIKNVVPAFKRQRSGVIINTSSESGLGRVSNVPYASAKEGVIGMTRSVARELGRFGIRCNAIRPRAVGTLMGADNVERLKRFEPLNRALGRFYLGEMGHTVSPQNRPEDVAVFVTWLASDVAGNINGRTFLVGGDSIVLYSEPQWMRVISRDGGWDLGVLDRTVPRDLVFDLKNEFLAESIGDREL